MTVATALSFFHIRHRARSFRALANVGSSWLSREILFELAFIGTAALAGLCEWRGTGSPAFVKALFVLSGLAGILFLVAMSRIYMLPALTAWRSAYTPTSFFLAAAVIGATSSGLLLRMSPGVSGWTRPLLAVAIVSVAASFGAALLFAPGHGLFVTRAVPSLRPLRAGGAALHSLRLAALAGGSALLAAGLAATGVGGGAPEVSAVLSACGLALASAGEVLGRIVFYGVGPRQRYENK
jgi:DMSO reductase anchor subunit